MSVDCNVQSAVMPSAKDESEVKKEKSSSEFDLMYMVAYAPVTVSIEGASPLTVKSNPSPAIPKLPGYGVT